MGMTDINGDWAMAEQAADGSEAAQRADRALRQLIHSAGVTQAVFVAAKAWDCRPAARRATDAAEVALATGSHTASLHRVLPGACQCRYLQRGYGRAVRAYSDGRAFAER